MAEARQQRNTADLLVECLEEEEVHYIFGIPGEENLPVMNAIEKSNIEFITVRHEQGAAFMADVYGRLTGKAGVCLATLGPGATNLITGVADADCDGAPLVAISGQVGTDKMHITAHQYLDLRAMFEPITRRAYTVVRPDTVSEITRLAFKYAEREKPGATFIDLPINISKMPVDDAEKPLLHKVITPETAMDEQIEAAAKIISHAKKPVILAGSGVIRGHAAEMLTKFSEKLKLPVINTMMAKGAIPFDNKYSLWTVGIPMSDYQSKVLEEASLVIAVGYDIIEYNPAKWNTKQADIIHIDMMPADINKHYQPEVEVVGDIPNTLFRIMKKASRLQEPTSALDIRKKMVEEHEQYADDISFPVKPQRALIDARKVMGKDDIVISDVGAHKVWIARHYNCYKPNTCIISNGFATMGIAVPGAIAAKLVHPDRKVLAIAGDAGFLMNCQEFETAHRLGVNFVTLIFNDASYGLIKWKQDDQFGHHCYVDFTNPDFVKLAESMGAIGYRITRTEELLPTLKQAFNQNKPVIIDCPIDYDENMKLTHHLEALMKELQ
ncbi:MAG: acetolactate synthase large subunit [Megasphaera sp.]|jgi:acetolactate synthase-1/2/3 large subunit|uniref:acetolactate synthase large subunit n=1 Tax=Megasphaera sueciensis TaxID=349094 RepID=UPI003D05EAF8|nr:acetolactate synthase large subunit [Megasphaera sp.]MCI1824119.1 acetolactate synthase large subunit [Megasphaera sp.]